jgi:F subunit of K+-transporting ATPase
MRAMTIVDGVLLTVSVVVFGYLGIAMFKPEWF